MVKHKVISLAVLLWILFAGCDSTIHEYPSPEAPAEPQPFELRLTFDTEMPLYRTVEYSRVTELTAPNGLDVRHKVAIFRADETGVFGDEPDDIVTIVNDGSEGLDTSIPMELVPGDYRFIAWSDYVEPGSESDRLYDTGDFHEIAILGGAENYHGCDESRDAFRGMVKATVRYAAAEKNVAEIEMQRPLAKYSFIANDVSQYLEENGVDNLDNIVVRMYYNYFMPCSYDLYTQQNSNSWWGVVYEGRVLQINDEKAEIGFDYVFVGEGEHTVQVSVAVYRKDSGGLISGSAVIDVPLMRSKHTIVMGNFLTEEPSGTVIIDPDFDGDFNNEITY